MKNVSTAFVKAQKEFAPALKCATNPHFKSKYADLAACIESVMDALNNNGLALMQFSLERPDGVAVETRLIHESGEILECGVLFVPASKKDAQGYGSALTYARRYSLMAACGIAPEDDDGNSAKPAAPRQQAPAMISLAQCKELDDLITAAGGTVVGFCEKQGIDNLSKLNQQEFNTQKTKLITIIGNIQK